MPATEKLTGPSSFSPPASHTLITRPFSSSLCMHGALFPASTSRNSPPRSPSSPTSKQVLVPPRPHPRTSTGPYTPPSGPFFAPHPFTSSYRTGPGHSMNAPPTQQPRTPTLHGRATPASIYSYRTL
ncbi:hypothetical protein DENSPDRAFT_147973 [Dentipellis sp. KUC8613]|nr:hypothetical protein DENSPDRAFT_147973 [Dentipellis sp. KUC8613]